MSANTTTAQTTICRLLELPAALRNRIYRYTLVTKSVGIGPHTFSRPALLKTCRQIRSEATAIYYRENVLYVRTFDFEHRLMADFCQPTGASFRSTKPSLGIRMMMRHSASSWNTLVDWFAAFREGLVFSVAHNPNCKAQALSSFNHCHLRCLGGRSYLPSLSSRDRRRSKRWVVGSGPEQSMTRPLTAAEHTIRISGGGSISEL